MAFSAATFAEVAFSSEGGLGPIAVTGLVATGAVGSVVVVINESVSVTGLAGTGQVGSASIVSSSILPVTGLEVTGTVGSVTATGDANVAITAPSRAQVFIGIVSADVQTNVTVTGVEATCQVGTVGQEIWNEIIPSQDPNWVEIAA